MNNKIMKTQLKGIVMTGIFIQSFTFIFGQAATSGSYGLPVINKVSLYQQSLRNHPEKQMVSLAQIPGIIMDLRYSSGNNFMHKRLYPENTKVSFLREPAFQALGQVAKELACKGLVPVVFDAYRPYTITVVLWNPIKDERYAANPTKGSGHNRGTAVDLTLADSKTHQLLAMPTDFDSFSDSADQSFRGIDENRISNKELLKQVMIKYGFIPLSTEWWHFSWPDAEKFEVLDLSFKQLNDLQ
ncbi:MAG TPA: M15 family metallopeptidase [Puia sp.]